MATHRVDKNIRLGVSSLYEKYAKANGWHCVSRQIDNKASGAKTKEKKSSSCD